MKKITKKILGVFISLLVVAMFSVPATAVLAKKPEPAPTFYGIPMPAMPEQYFIGNSDNLIVLVDSGWVFCLGYHMDYSNPLMPVAVPEDVLAEGVCNGRYVFHGYEGTPPFGTFTHITGPSFFTVTVSNWDGEPVEEGEFVLLLTGGGWTIVSGTIDGMKLHGSGTSSMENDFVYKYEGTIHFTP